MKTYDGEELLKEVKKAPHIIARFNYYKQPPLRLLRFSSIFKEPVGEIYLTNQSLYVFRKSRGFDSDPRKTGVKIDRTGVRGVQLAESKLFIELKPQAYRAYKEFYKQHNPLKIKSPSADDEVNSISFYHVDEKEAMKLVQNLNTEQEKKKKGVAKAPPNLNINIDNIVIPENLETTLGAKKKEEAISDKDTNVEKGGPPPELRAWVNHNRKRDAALDDIDWKILTFLYEHIGIDKNRTDISKEVGMKSAMKRIKRLVNLGLISTSKKGEKGKILHYTSAYSEK